MNEALKPEAIASMIASIEGQLAALSQDSGWRDASRAHAAGLERLRLRYVARISAVDRVHSALARLREITVPSTILQRAPQVFCEGCELTRAIVSLKRKGHLVAEAVHFHDDPAGAQTALESLAANPPRLEHPLIEADLLRRRRATIVADVKPHPRTHGPATQVLGWHSYVAAPILVRGEVLGAMHADAGPSGRAPDVLDADILWMFVSGLAEIYETASLRRSLRHQRAELREFVDWLGARASELDNASMALAAAQASPPAPPGQPAGAVRGAAADDRIVFEGVLTRRELEVLRLLSQGETNSGIAAELVISEGTVKFHVSNILRKLHVGNRVEAVSRYHRLVGATARTDRDS